MGETASGRKGEAERALRESEESRGPRGFWVLLQTRAYGTSGSTCSHIGRMGPISPIRNSNPPLGPSPIRRFALIDRRQKVIPVPHVMRVPDKVRNRQLSRRLRFLAQL